MTNKTKNVKILSDFFIIENHEGINSGLNTPEGFLKDGMGWFFDDEEKDIENLSYDELCMMHQEVCNVACSGFHEAMQNSYNNDYNDYFLYECVAKFITFNAAIKPRFYRNFMATGRARINFNEENNEWSITYFELLTEQSMYDI